MDQVNVSLPIDITMSLAAEQLAPYKNLMDLSAPRQLADTAAIAKPVINTFGEFLKTPDVPDPVKLAKMAELLPTA